MRATGDGVAVGATESEVIMPAPRAVVTSEAPAAPLLLTIYEDRGLAGRIELSPRAALHLALDLLQLVAVTAAYQSRENQ